MLYKLTKITKLIKPRNIRKNYYYTKDLYDDKNIITNNKSKTDTKLEEIIKKQNETNQLLTEIKISNEKILSLLSSIFK
jgi:hypothetical protein